jgi:hypothetical protein
LQHSFSFSLPASWHLPSHHPPITWNYTVCIYSLKRQWRSWLSLCATRWGGPGLDSQWGPWKFSNDLILLSAFNSPGVQSSCTRNEYQGISLGVKCGRCVELKIVPL